MTETPRGAIEQLKSIWDRLTRSQRISLAAFSGAVLLALIVLIVSMNGQEYQTLYSGLNSEDAGAVVNKLKERKIAYQVTDGGVIKAPAEKVNEIRLQMASEGLPQSGRIGFEIFDKTNFGITDFTAQVNYRRALEGELERTIRSLEEVSNVRVHLTLPKESLFTQQSESAKASVFLRLKSGRQLAPGSPGGIKHLVSSAVEGLRPENVTILDTHAKVLSPGLGTEGPHASLTQNEMAIQRQAEKELSDKVISMLEPVVGPGKVRANTSLHMDFSTGEVTEEMYSPANNPVVSQQKSEEKLVPGAALGGIPGTRSNQPGAQPAPAAATSPAGSPIPLPDARVKQNEITNFEVSRTVRHTTLPKGAIKKLSVAVVVDDKLTAQKPKDKKDSKGPPVLLPAPRTAEEMKNLRALVEGAVGFNKERGDLITVENITFESALGQEPEKPVTFITRYPEYTKMAIRYGAILVLIVLAHFFLLRPIMRHLLAPPQEPPTEEAKALLPGETAHEITPSEMATMTAGAGESLSAPSPAVQAPPAPLDWETLEANIEAELGQSTNAEGVRMTLLKKKIIEMIQRDPQTTANLIRTWLEDSDSRL